MTITLYEEEISLTIKQILHRAGEGVESLSLRDAVQLDGDASDTQLIRRLIRTGIARLKSQLREHLAETTDTGDDRLSNGYDTYVFSLDLSGDGQGLADLMHWYVVWRALAGILPSFGLEAMTNRAISETADAENLIHDETLSLSMPIKARRQVTRNESFRPIITLSPSITL